MKVLVDGLLYEVEGVAAFNGEDALNFWHAVDFEDFFDDVFGDGRAFGGNSVSFS